MPGGRWSDLRGAHEEVSERSGYAIGTYYKFDDITPPDVSLSGVPHGMMCSVRDDGECLTINCFNPSAKGGQVRESRRCAVRRTGSPDVVP